MEAARWKICAGEESSRERLESAGIFIPTALCSVILLPIRSEEFKGKEEEEEEEEEEERMALLLGGLYSLLTNI